MFFSALKFDMGVVIECGAESQGPDYRCTS